MDRNAKQPLKGAVFLRFFWEGGFSREYGQKEAVYRRFFVNPTKDGGEKQKIQ